MSQFCYSRLFCFQLFILLLKLTYGTDLDSTKVNPRLPKTTLRQLSDYLDGRVHDNLFLRDASGKIGVFAITGLDKDYVEAISKFQSTAPDCLKNYEAQLPVNVMSDGSSRRTFATEEKAYPGCLTQPMVILSGVYDRVEKLVTKLIEKQTGHHNITYLANGQLSVLDKSPIKDHLHVYTQSEKSKIVTTTEDLLVPFHIDNGLFLILTPFPSPSLQVKLSNGQKISTSGLASNSLLVLMGRGLTEWLLQEEKSDFYPVAHAVPTLSGSTTVNRAVFARMKVVPMNAVPFSKANKDLTEFGEIFYDTKGSKKMSSKEDLCIGSVPETLKNEPGAEFFQANVEQCVNNTAYCWMACLNLPPGCDEAESECYNNEHVPCFPDSHDVTCDWHCKDPNPEPEPGDFCTGGMDMLMGGFETSGKSNKTKICVILFFESWKLNTAGKFAGACVGVFVLGFAIEAIIAFRRRLMTRKRTFLNLPIYVRKTIVISLFGVNLVLGYLAMLVAMTYSVELFICVVAGLIAGHGIFNSHMPVGETIDPCCASQNQNESSGDRSPITRTPCENDDYQEMAPNGPILNDGDNHSLCNCDDATSNTNIKV